MKVCGKCCHEKPFQDFPKNRSKKDGFNGWCKSCSSEYHKEWRASNLEKTQSYSAEWYARNKESVKSRSKQWYIDNIERATQSRAQWSAANRDKVNEYSRRWHAANKEKSNAAVKRWRINNHDRAMFHVERRRQRKANAPGNGVSPEQWAAMLVDFNGTCAYCNTPYDKPIMEHMDPLSTGGAHDISNVVPVCNDCNARKGTLTVLEFLTGFRFSRKVG